MSITSSKLVLMIMSGDAGEQAKHLCSERTPYEISELGAAGTKVHDGSSS
jgi:hypothetical protein